MAGVFDKLSDLHRMKLSWRFRVYVKRLYEHRFSGSDAFSLDMILQDSEGVRVHAFISSQMVSRWVGVINEFKLYEMENFIVVNKKPFIRSTTTPFSLQFSHRTKVKLVEEPSFPLDVFNFRPFTEILNPVNVDESEMFDVMGEVVGKEEPREVVTSKGVHVKRMIIVLEDLGSNRLCCVLFGNLVDQMLPYLNEESFDLLLLCCSILKCLAGMWINPELSVVDDFRSILLNGETSNGIRITQVPSQSVVSATQELKKGNVLLRSIEDIFNAEEESETWIFGKIEAVCVGKRNWYYESCVKCYKKAERNSEGKYKVEVVAFDGTACINLLLWDRECKYLCEIEASNLVALLNDKDDDEQLNAFEKMLDMKLLFKINVKATNIQQTDNVYAVMNICDDDDMIKKHQPADFEDDFIGSPNEVGGSNSLDASGITVNLESDLDTRPIGVVLQRSVNNVKSKIAAKKSIATVKSCMKNMQKNEVGQSSTNRITKKGQKKGVKRPRVIFDDTED
ncbi:hypothetical protein PIB30_030519 [Stylosanthes scabra]|uniref:Replication protein A 70 kDa DNA-binding subunit B/D first OB fold domain-containing protein n=1 Tax=Stylosanthes scabra TaxID=79078 RepID=A0ABU6YBY4_9FABA|nr:hypothetical protein [Stylosanthes scabra]